MNEIIDKREKIKKEISVSGLYDPYEKLRSIPEVHKYLKKDIALEMLDKIAKRYTGNRIAEKVQLARDKLFDKIVAI